MKTIIIMGSSRSNGTTRKFVDILAKNTNATVIDLNDYNISYYDYEARNLNDDFMGIAKQMLEAENIVLASPVYWYAMSAQLKTFMDRFSDLITVEKTLGRALAGKNLFILSTSSGKELAESFLVPFKGMANYLKMKYSGNFHGYLNKGEFPTELINETNNFSILVKNSKKLTVC